MKLIRYEVVSPSGESTGIFTTKFDYSKGAKSLGISNFQYLDLKDECSSWLAEPEQPGEYWFTLLGNHLFETLSLPILQAGLLSNYLLVKVHIEADDTPLYQDKYQACF